MAPTATGSPSTQVEKVSNGARSNKSAELVKKLRDRFLQEYEENKYEDIYDEADLVKIHDDWYLKRFLLANNRDIDASFKMLDETMRWRNDMYISQIRDYHFPTEFYAIGGIFPYEQDRDGNLVLYMRIKMHHKVPELEEPTRGFVVHNFNKAETLCKGQGFAIVFDLTGLGYSNVDIPFLSFLIQFGRNHFPGSLVYIVVYNLPWLFSALQKVAFAMLPAEATGIIKFAKGDEIFKYIAPENCPDYIPGGTCRRNFRAVAPGSKPILDLVTAYGYTRETYDRIYPIFQPDLEEAAEIMSQRTYDDPPEGFFDDMTGVEWSALPLPSQRVREPKKRPAEESTETQVKKLATESSKKVELSILPMETLCFISEGSNYICEMDLANRGSDFIAFNILSTNPKNYRLSTHYGILAPQKSLRVTIVNSSLNGPGLKDKFRVDARIVSSADLSYTEFRRLWSATNREFVTSFKLRTKVTETNDVADTSILSTSSTSYGPQSLISTFDDLESSGISSIPSKSIPLEQQVKRLNRKLAAMERKYSRLFTLFSFLIVVIFALLFVVIVDNVCGLNHVLPSFMSIQNMNSEKFCSLASSAGGRNIAGN